MYRQLLVTGAVVLVVFTPPAGAAPRTSCRLVIDAERDVRDSTGRTDVRSPASLDLTSADISSDLTHVTGTIRVRDLSAWREEGTGIGFEFKFTVGKVRYMYEARTSYAREGIDPLREQGSVVAHDFFLLRQTGGTVDREYWRYLRAIPGYFDEDSSEIVMTATLADLGMTARTRATATDLRSSSRTYKDALVVQGMHSVDDATSDKSYPMRTPSCAPVFHG